MGASPAGDGSEKLWEEATPAMANAQMIWLKLTMVVKFLKKWLRKNEDAQRIMLVE
jgi:hypothetical protein